MLLIRRLTLRLLLRLGGVTEDGSCLRVTDDRLLGHIRLLRRLTLGHVRLLLLLRRAWLRRLLRVLRTGVLGLRLSGHAVRVRCHGVRGRSDRLRRLSVSVPSRNLHRSLNTR